ncbi:hypothetical protein ACJIZ3_025727 [Penstemon smallii]|uniref:Uncharacterized protein n=1 Tax=Penstemon smallii TaxID=265156 RepID=A0ABD3TWR5_9LAMI
MDRARQNNNHLSAAASTSNIGPSSMYSNSVRPSEIPYNPVGPSYPSQIETLLNMFPQFHQHQYVQHVAAAERPNIHQLPMHPYYNTYLKDKSHERNQGLFFINTNNNHLNQTNPDIRSFQQIPQQLQMQQLTRTQTGLVPQGVHLGPSQGSTHQVQLANSSDWIDAVYEQFWLMKRMYLPEVVRIHERALELMKVATDLETLARYEKIRANAQDILKYLELPKSEILRPGEEKAYQTMKNIKLYIDSFMQKQPIPTSQSRTEQNVNVPQFYGTPTSSQNADDSHLKRSTTHPSVQVSQGSNLSILQNSVIRPSQINARLDQETSTQNMKKPAQKTNDDTRLRHLIGSNSKNSFLGPSSSSLSVNVSPENPRPSNDVNSEKSPFLRLVQVVKSMASENLNASLLDIEAVTSATDRIGIQGWESNKVIVQDLANDIRNYEDGNFGTGIESRMKRQLTTSSTETEFCDSFGMKRQKKEPKDKLLKEIEETNHKLMEVVVDVMNVKGCVGKTGIDEGTRIRFSYNPIGLFRNTRMASNSRRDTFPYLILELVVKADYPLSSPTILETEPPRCSEDKEGKDMWILAKSKFSLSLRKFSEPISLMDMAKSWDFCAREVYREFAERYGGGHVVLSSGKWETV